MPKASPRSNMTGRATLHDVAKSVGVHYSTVSSVMAGKAKARGISDQLEARIRHAAEELDFAPNLLANSLHVGHTNIIALFNGFRRRDIFDFYLNGLLTGINDCCGELGKDVLTYCNFERTAEEQYRHINGGHCDGLIFYAPRRDDELLPYLRKSRMPVTLLNARDEAGLLSSVESDSELGLSRMADALVAGGHRRIATLLAKNHTSDASERVRTLQRLCAERDRPIPAEWQLEVDEWDSATLRQVVLMITQNPQPATALFCCFDHLGYRILDVCEEVGIQVPTQLAVLGFDGLRWPSRTVHRLASVRVDLRTMGESAVRILTTQVNQDYRTPVQKVVLVEFDSGTTLIPVSAMRL